MISNLCDLQKVLEKETQLLLAQTELNNIKKQLQSAENTKSKTLSELDKAKVTLQELRKKLNSVRESKQSAIEATKVVKEERSTKQQWRKKVDASTQQLNKIRQYFDTALEARLAAFQTLVVVTN